MKLPDFLLNRNAYVEVVSASKGLSRSQPFFSHDLNVQINENYGQLIVSLQATNTDL